MSWRAVVIFAVAGTLMAGCGSPKPKAATKPDSGSRSAALRADDPFRERPAGIYDMGDAEFSITSTLTLAQEAPAEWTVRELRDNKGNVALVTADIKGAAPESVEVLCTLTCAQNFATSPVIVRGRVLREVDGAEQALGEFSAVAGANAIEWPIREGQEPTAWAFNAVEGLTALPRTMLLKVQLTLLMTPLNTDEASIDPDTMEVPSDRQAIEFSNPMRLNFDVTPAAPAEDVEAANAVQ
jgi:hypothetical protein